MPNRGFPGGPLEGDVRGIRRDNAGSTRMVLDRTPWQEYPRGKSALRTMLTGTWSSLAQNSLLALVIIHLSPDNRAATILRV